MLSCSAHWSQSHKKVMNIFQTPGSGSLSVTAMLDFSGKANSPIHGLGEDDLANQLHYPLKNVQPCFARHHFY